MGLRSFHQQGVIEAGIDEAGRGCLAGPVVAAAVILPEAFSNRMLNDSKKLSHSQRMSMRPLIMEQALAWGIGVVWNEEIDEINILNATYLAMHQAVDKLSITPQMLLIDGNRFKAHNIPHECIIKGDGLYYSIAAASILAKTERDLMMMKLHQEHPEFCWDKNKGYPTKDHKNAIANHGITKYHRRSFNLNPQLSIGF